MIRQVMQKDGRQHRELWNEPRYKKEYLSEVVFGVQTTAAGSMQSQSGMKI